MLFYLQYLMKTKHLIVKNASVHSALIFLLPNILFDISLSRSRLRYACECIGVAVNAWQLRMR